MLASDSLRVEVGLLIFLDGIMTQTMKNPWKQSRSYHDDMIGRLTFEQKKWSLSKRLSTNLIPGSISANSSFFTIIYLYKFVHFPFSLFVCATVCTGRTKCVLCFVYIPFSPIPVRGSIRSIESIRSTFLVCKKWKKRPKSQFLSP